ncbi:MAG: hypothetical protein HYR63_23750 [Proteobacteria bacterium]|nr:hypothetical protein [Pseudomonadota bacterium]
MATTYPSPYSSALSRSPAPESARHRWKPLERAAPRLLALTHLAGLAGAAGFIGVFLLVAAASLAEPVAQIVLLAVFVAPLWVLAYFMRQTWAVLRSRPSERRRAPERSEGLVIDA